jgi:hypothetical protein
MTYTKQQITSAGLNLDNVDDYGFVYNVLAYTTAPVTLLGNVVINPISITAGIEVSFSLRWEANITLSTFSVVVVGVTFPQDQVNQTGTFSCYYDGTAWSVQYFADGKDQPQAAQGVTDIPVPVGGTKTLTAGVDAAYQRLVGSPTTLTSNYTVTAGTTGIKAGSQFQIDIAGGITIGANTLTVFGVSINANQALNGGVIIFATFDGVSTWVAASTSRPISTADIDPVTALSVMGNATNATAAPTDIAFPTDYGVLQRNGTTLTTGLLTADNFAIGTPVMQLAVTSLSSAQILASFTTPIKILDTLATYAIIHNIVILMSPGTAYATNSDARIYFQLATDDLMVADGVWGATSSGGYQAFFLNLGTTAYQVGKASDLFIATSTGNPTAGTGTAQVLVYYTLYN